MSLLTINAGSSTLKFGLFDDEVGERLVSGMIDHETLVIERAGREPVRSRVEAGSQQAALQQAMETMFKGLPEAQNRLNGIGHRVVHGGDRLQDSVLIDEEVRALIAQCADLAPLHNPPALEGIDAARAILPDAPHVAVFDTAFYAHLPPEAAIYPLPYEWHTDLGIRRFGFHGISHGYCAHRTAELMSREPDTLRLITCHLGAGCSATAVRNGTAIATTMGYTPIEGLMMGSRSGSVDPGVLLHMLRQGGLTVDQLDNALNHRSGLLGVSGVSSDFRRVEAAARAGDPRARLALDIYADRVRSNIGALAVTLGGVDALVFTAGVGENAVQLREDVCSGLQCLGIRLDRAKNVSCRPDTDISVDHGAVRIFVLHTREDLMIARETRRVVLGRKE